MSVQMRDDAMVAVVMRVPMTERKRGLNRAARKIVDVACNVCLCGIFQRVLVCYWPSDANSGNWPLMADN